MLLIRQCILFIKNTSNQLNTSFYIYLYFTITKMTRRCIIHAFAYIQGCITTYIHIDLDTVYIGFIIKLEENGPIEKKSPTHGRVRKRTSNNDAS